MIEEHNEEKVSKRIRLIDFLILVVISLNVILAAVLRIIGSQMYPFFIIVYLWIPIYALMLTLLLKRDRLSKIPIVRGAKGISIVMCVTFGVRAVFLGLEEYISLDPLWYLDFGKFMIDGSIPYFDFYFPYPPVFGYAIFFLVQLLPSVDVFRLFATLLDTALIPIIWRLVSNQVDKRWASIAIMAYAMLPISVIESGWNGHFEPLVNLFLLLSIWFLLQGRYRFAGVSLGLAAATKLYPLLLFPIYFSYLQNWRSRIELTLVTGATGAITFLPYFLQLLWRVPSESIDGPPVSSSGLIESFLGFILFPSFPGTIISGFVIFCVIFGMFLIHRQITKGKLDSNGRAFNRLTIFFGFVLILLGITAGIYAVIPISRLVYWRYPLDVGFVRGITGVILGLLVIFVAAKQWKAKAESPVQIDSLLIMISATLLLLIALSRNVFYGWYLLWSIPLFFFLRDRRLGLTIILCLLLVYPSYTHDNFSSLGYEEERLWSEDMIEVSGWSAYINANSSSVNSSLISCGVARIEGENAGLLWFDTESIDKEMLENMSIEYSLDVSVFLNMDIEFVARILSQWDPTFGGYSDLGLKFSGIAQNGTSIEGDIIERTSIFTNLTYILWRSSLTTQIGIENITILKLTFIVYPLESVRAGYILDYMYTTYYGILNPVYVLMVPSLIALALVAFTFLHLELEHPEHEEKVTISERQMSSS